MVIGGRRVNLWIWWSIGWTVMATLIAVQFKFRPVAMLVALTVGALVPRVLEASERISLGRRLALAIATMGALVALFSTGPWHYPRVLIMGVVLAAPSLIAGLLLSGFLPRAQPFLRRGLAMTIAFSALVIALGIAPGSPFRHSVTPSRIVRMLWPMALAALSVVPPLSWRRAPGEQALLAEQTDVV